MTTLNEIRNKLRKGVEIKIADSCVVKYHQIDIRDMEKVLYFGVLENLLDKKNNHLICLKKVGQFKICITSFKKYIDIVNIGTLENINNNSVFKYIPSIIGDPFFGSHYVDVVFCEQYSINSKYSIISNIINKKYVKHLNQKILKSIIQTQNIFDLTTLSKINTYLRFR